METGIYIWAQINGRVDSIDIGDPRLVGEQLLRWLAILKDDQVLVTIDRVRDAINRDAATPDDYGPDI